jgi:hypothetical protein
MEPETKIFWSIVIIWLLLATVFYFGAEMNEVYSILSSTFITGLLIVGGYYLYTSIKKRNNPDYGRDPQVVAYEQRNPY